MLGGQSFGGGEEIRRGTRRGLEDPVNLFGAGRLLEAPLERRDLVGCRLGVVDPGGDDQPLAAGADRTDLEAFAVPGEGLLAMRGVDRGRMGGPFEDRLDPGGATPEFRDSGLERIVI